MRISSFIERLSFLIFSVAIVAGQTTVSPVAETPFVAFDVTGDCDQQSNCVSSLGYPNARGNAEALSGLVDSCTVTLDGDAYLTVGQYFLLGTSDELKMADSEILSKTDIPWQMFRAQQIEWDSRYTRTFSGWQVCFWGNTTAPSVSPSRSPTSPTQFPTHHHHDSNSEDFPWVSSGIWLIILSVDGICLLLIGCCIGYYCGKATGKNEAYEEARRARTSSIKMTRIEGHHQHHSSRSGTGDYSDEGEPDEQPQLSAQKTAIWTPRNTGEYDEDEYKEPSGSENQVEVWSNTARKWLIANVIRDLPDDKIEVEYFINGDPYRKKLYKYDQKKVRSAKVNE